MGDLLWVAIRSKQPVVAIDSFGRRRLRAETMYPGEPGSLEDGLNQAEGLLKKGWRRLAEVFLDRASGCADAWRREKGSPPLYFDGVSDPGSGCSS